MGYLQRYERDGLNMLLPVAKELMWVWDGRQAVILMDGDSSLCDMLGIIWGKWQ